jgi:hypothetical protein
VKQSLINLGAWHAREVLHKNLTYGTGKCEHCGIIVGELYESGAGASQCRACFAEEIEEWEEREGCSSEFIFPDRLPDESSRVFRTVMGSYFATLHNGGK